MNDEQNPGQDPAQPDQSHTIPAADTGTEAGHAPGTPDAGTAPDVPAEQDTAPVAAPAGWYDDPQAPGYQRYWDGAEWGDSTAAGPQPAVAPMVAQAPGGYQQPAVWSTTPMSDVERRALLARQIQFSVAQGGRVESQSDFQAVIVSGSKVNHVLHAILTIVTCVWGIVWIVLAATGGETRQMIVVDEFGNVQVQQLGKV